MARSNGRPEPEVIVAFGDGGSYSRAKLDEAFRNLPDKVKPATTSLNVKKEHVELIVQEFGITKTQAEKALAVNGGDLEKTIRALITPPWPGATSTANGDEHTVVD